MADLLLGFSTDQGLVILVLPRGGVPVAPPDMLERLRKEADEVIAVAEPEQFGSVGHWYADFSQTSDDEVRELLESVVEPKRAPAEANSLISNLFGAGTDLPLRGSGCGAKAPTMVPSILTHPLATFVAGALVATLAVFLLLNSHAIPNRSAQAVAEYRSRMEKVAPSGLDAGSPGEQAALERFKGFLQGIGDVKFVRENTLKVYAADAYLDDTLVVHHGAAEIEAYFVKTSETMTSYQVTIDDVARSGSDYYIRWTMVFSAPALSGGKPVHSIGVSQIRLNREGKVAFHQDFWDSGKNFYGHLPVVGGAVGYVRKRLESN